jgi:hypothetical protein
MALTYFMHINECSANKKAYSYIVVFFNQRCKSGVKDAAPLLATSKVNVCTALLFTRKEELRKKGRLLFSEKKLNERHKCQRKISRNTNTSVHYGMMTYARFYQPRD